MNATTLLVAVLRTEISKLKRTLALRMAFVAPGIVILLYGLIYSIGADKAAKTPDVWRDITNNATGLWTILMLPLFVTLETSLLAGLEHTDKNWKNLLALPPPRWMIYLSKLIVTVLIVLMAHVLLVTGLIGLGYFLKTFFPVLHIAALPTRFLIVLMLKVSVAGLLALTIQHWVSLRWQTFTAAMGFGMSVMVIGFLAVNSSEWGPRVPWSMPMYTIRAHGGDLTQMLATSLLVAAIVAAAGSYEFSRRDVL